MFFQAAASYFMISISSLGQQRLEPISDLLWYANGQQYSVQTVQFRDLFLLLQSCSLPSFQSICPFRLDGAFSG